MAAPTLTLSGTIGGEIAAPQVQAFLETNAGSPVTLSLNSPGGSVFAGLEIATAIRDHGNVTVRVTALAASAATLLTAAAKQVVFAPGSMAMLHRASAMTLGDSKAHRKSADVLDQIDSQVLDLYLASMRAVAKP